MNILMVDDNEKGRRVSKELAVSSVLAAFGGLAGLVQMFGDGAEEGVATFVSRLIGSSTEDSWPLMLGGGVLWYFKRRGQSKENPPTGGPMEMAQDQVYEIQERIMRLETSDMKSMHRVDGLKAGIQDLQRGLETQSASLVDLKRQSSSDATTDLWTDLDRRVGVLEVNVRSARGERPTGQRLSGG